MKFKNDYDKALTHPLVKVKSHEKISNFFHNLADQRERDQHVSLSNLWPRITSRIIILLDADVGFIRRDVKNAQPRNV